MNNSVQPVTGSRSLYIIIALVVVSTLISFGLFVFQITKGPPQVVGRVQQVTPTGIVLERARGEAISITYSSTTVFKEPLGELDAGEFVRITGTRQGPGQWQAERVQQIQGPKTKKQ